jgi:glycerophosphoryl diester phosphodiesterase
MDLQLTGDGQWVAWHDEDLSRIGLPQIKVGDLSLEKLLAEQRKALLDPAHHSQKNQVKERIPVWADLVETCRAMKGWIFLEVKIDDSILDEEITSKAKNFFKQLKSKPFSGRVVVISFCERFLRSIKAMDSSLRVMFLWPEEGMRPASPFWQEVSWFGLGFDIDCPPPELFSESSKAWKLLCYTCVTDSHYERAHRLEVDYWMCDDPNHAKAWENEYLKKAELAPSDQGRCG